MTACVEIVTGAGDDRDLAPDGVHGELKHSHALFARQRPGFASTAGHHQPVGAFAGQEGEVVAECPLVEVAVDREGRHRRHVASRPIHFSVVHIAPLAS